jgi:hypothetical protein
MTKKLLDLARQFSDDDLGLLEKLNEVGAATVTGLAVRVRQLPEKVQPLLNEFRKHGLVEVTQIDQERDNELFRVSDRGRKVLRLVNPV